MAIGKSKKAPAKKATAKKADEGPAKSKYGLPDTDYDDLIGSLVAKEKARDWPDRFNDPAEVNYAARRVAHRVFLEGCPDHVLTDAQIARFEQEFAPTSE